MEQTVSKVLNWLRSTAAPKQKLGIVKGTTLSKCDSLAIELVKSLGSSHERCSVRVVAPVWKASLLRRRLEEANLPLTADFVVESPVSCAARILQNCTDESTGTSFKDWRILRTRHDMQSFLLANMAKLPQNSLRPVVTPAYHAPKLIEHFHLLDSALISEAEYQSVSDKKGSSESNVAQDAANLYAAFQKILQDEKLLTIGQAAQEAAQLLSSINRPENNEDRSIEVDVWGGRCDVLIVDEVSSYSSSDLLLLGPLGYFTRNASIFVVNESPDASGSHFDTGIRVRGLDYLCTQLGGSIITEMMPFMKPPTVSLQGPCSNEIETLLGWINALPVTENICVTAMSSNACEDIRDGLSAAGLDVSYEGYFEGILNAPEVRALHLFLTVICSGSNNSSDRELFFALVSPFLDYGATPEDIRFLSDLKLKQHLSMREALSHLECGKILLSDLKRAEDMLMRGHGTSSIALEYLKRRKVLGKLEKPKTQQDVLLADVVGRYLGQLTRSETLLGGSLTRAPAIMWEVLAHAAGKLSTELVTSSTPKPRIRILPMRQIVGDSLVGEIPNLIIADASSGQLPGRTRSSISLPRELFEARSRDDDRPSIEVRAKDQIGMHEEAMHNLFEAVLARSANGKALITFREGDRPSMFLAKYAKNYAEATAASLHPTSRRNVGKTTTNGSTQRSFVTMSNLNGGEHDWLQLSFSRLSQYMNCPKQYHFSRVLGLSAPANPAMVYGRALHAGVEEFLTNWSGGTIDEAIHAFVQTFDDQFSDKEKLIPVGFHSKEHIEEAKRTGENVLRNFHARWKARSLVQIIAVEKLLELEWSDLKVRFTGFIDLVESNPHGRLTIVDFKSNMFQDVKLRRNVKATLQLDLYAWAYEKCTGSRIDFVALESLETGHRAERQPQKNDETESILREYAERIRRNEFDASPGYAKCSFCPYQTICMDSWHHK